MFVGRSIVFQLDENTAQPLFLNLAASIQREIERGRLKPGDALPGTRALAKSLQIHRNTVDAAYQDLMQQGWLITEPSRGTFVARDLPDSFGRAMAQIHRTQTARGPARDLSGSRQNMVISDGTPDVRLMPRTELARAFRRVLASPVFLSGQGYGGALGNDQLRQALSDYLADERGLAVSPDRILVTRGSQMALFLSGRDIARPGDAIAVETPGYPLAWDAFRASGARIVGVPVDAEGMQVDALKSLCLHDPSVRAVYVTPHHQYPTTVTLSPDRRHQLINVVRQFGLTLIEDDYDHDYRFDGRPILPLFTQASAEVDIVYIGSLSKLLAPGIRLGYVAASPQHLSRMAQERLVIDRQGDLPLEHAVARLIVDGDLRRHAHKARRIYQARRDQAAALIADRLGSVVEFSLPAGGLALWLQIRDGSDVVWSRQARDLGLDIPPGSHFWLEASRSRQAFRFGYASLNEEDLPRAIDLLVRSHPQPGPASKGDQIA